MAKRDSVGTPEKKSTAPKSGKTSGRARKSTNDTMVDSLAIFIGKSVGTAVKRTRGLRKGVSKVGTEVVEAGSRAGQAIKEYLPEVLGGAPTKRPRKAKAAAPPRKKTKTTPPKPSRGQDPLTQQASSAKSKPAKSATRGSAAARRAPAGRRG